MVEAAVQIALTKITSFVEENEKWLHLHQRAESCLTPGKTANTNRVTKDRVSEYLLRFRKVGTFDWARPFPADASSTSRANEGPASSALPGPMAGRPWAMAELTRRAQSSVPTFLERRK